MVSKRVLSVSDARKRTFWISEELDLALRMKAIKENVRFSDIAEVGLRQYLGLKDVKKEKEKK